MCLPLPRVRRQPKFTRLNIGLFRITFIFSRKKNIPSNFIEHVASNSNTANPLRWRINSLTVSLILKYSHLSAPAHIKTPIHQRARFRRQQFDRKVPHNDKKKRDVFFCFFHYYFFFVWNVNITTNNCASVFVLILAPVKVQAFSLTRLKGFLNGTGDKRPSPRVEPLEQHFISDQKAASRIKHLESKCCWRGFIQGNKISDRPVWGQPKKDPIGRMVSDKLKKNHT